MKRLVIAFIVAGLLVAISASAAVARTTRVEVSGQQWVVGVVAPGTDTLVGSVRSVRGLVVKEAGLWSNKYVAGPAINTVNFDVDVNTGMGEMWGSGHHEVAALIDGGWDCSFHGPIVNGLMSGKGICHGTGTMRSWQWRATLTQTPSGVEMVEGYIFKPGD
jgi:hypothetical protein